MLLLLSGPIAVGKSAVARELSTLLSADIVSARSVLLRETDAVEARESLQAAGRLLDQRTNGRWLLHALEARLEASDSHLTILDSARTTRQTLPVLETITDSRLVYLDAAESARRARFESSKAGDSLKRQTDFEHSQMHTTERGILDLRSSAHFRMDTTALSLSETIAALIAELGLLPPG